MTLRLRDRGPGRRDDDPPLRPQRVPARRRLGAGVRGAEGRRPGVCREARRVRRALPRPARRADHAVGTTGQQERAWPAFTDALGVAPSRRSAIRPTSGPRGCPSSTARSTTSRRLHRPPDRRRDVPVHPRDGDGRDRPPPLRARGPGGDRAGLAGLDRPHVRLIRPEPTRNTEGDPAMTTPDTLQTVTSQDGTTIAVDISGGGPAIVLVSGGSVDRGANAGLAAALADGLHRLQLRPSRPRRQRRHGAVRGRARDRGHRRRHRRWPAATPTSTAARRAPASRSRRPPPARPSTGSSCGSRPTTSTRRAARRLTASSSSTG